MRAIWSWYVKTAESQFLLHYRVAKNGGQRWRLNFFVTIKNLEFWKIQMKFTRNKQTQCECDFTGWWNLPCCHVLVAFLCFWGLHAQALLSSLELLALCWPECKAAPNTPHAVHGWGCWGLGDHWGSCVNPGHSWRIRLEAHKLEQIPSESYGESHRHHN